MKRERFQGGYRLIILTILTLLGLFGVGYYEHHLPLNRSTLVIAILAAGLVCFQFRERSITYLEIQNERMLVNDGYREFGKDILDIRDIKYIYRVPQFVVAWFGGSLMVIYLRDDKGGIRHSALRERNYPEETLKQFLLRMKALKSTIELDPEYEQFLKGNIELREASKNTVASVEQRLRDKGEKWNTVGTLGKFLSKF